MKRPKFSARNLYNRDGGRCQYTGRELAAGGLLAFIVAALVGNALFGSSGSLIAVGVAVFVTILVGATRAAHEEKEGDKQDDQGDS